MAFIKKYWFLILLAFIATFLIFLKLATKEQPQPTAPQTREGTWKGIVPGQTTLKELSTTLGAPDPKLSDFSQNKLVYPNSEGAPHEAFVDSHQGILKLLKRDITESIKLAEFTGKYGPPEGEYYGPLAGAGFKVYIFSQKGVAVVAHNTQGTVSQIWYFEPITLDNFLTTWGKELTAQYEGHAD